MSWFTDRALKKEIKQLDESLKEANERAVSADIKVAKLQASNQSLNDKYGSKVKELNKIKKLVREQTGADLLVNALMELGVVPKPDKRNCFDERDALQRQMAAAQNSQQHYHGMGSYQGLSGLMGVTG